MPSNNQENCEDVSIEMSQLDTENDDPIKILKSVEEEKKKDKERQQRNDDIALVVCMVILMAVTAGVVMFKVMVVDELVDPNLSTFTPLEQEVHSNIKYIGMGCMPCNGYVPCQVIMTMRYL